MESGCVGIDMKKFSVQPISINRLEVDGAGDGDRTRDILLGKQTLYH
jgi:hypothetical protein|tara:strand:+ start:379 stop:519 length:141 start_codon:yes stop_codon:yes gene_type:complete